MCRSKSKWKDVPVWLRFLALVTLVNFSIFWLIAVKSGGDAWNGYQKNGHFFLGSHGTYTEVTEAFWAYSYYHVVVTLITYAAVFVGIAIFLNGKFKKMNTEPSHPANPRNADG